MLRAFEKYFDLKGRDITDIGMGYCGPGDFEAETHKLNGQRELLITHPRLAEGLEGGIFVKDEDGEGWNPGVTLEKVEIHLGD